VEYTYSAVSVSVFETTNLIVDRIFFAVAIVIGVFFISYLNSVGGNYGIRSISVKMQTLPAKSVRIENGKV
jgi:hypothetical protein